MGGHDDGPRSRRLEERRSANCYEHSSRTADVACSVAKQASPGLRSAGSDENTICSVAVERQTRYLVAEYKPALEGLSFTLRSNQAGVRARRVDDQSGRTLRRP